jgi:asparagine synthase (glutamine-hydrolysing)
MCGLAGLVCLKERCDEHDHVALVSSMCDVQTHRGPDDRGVLALGTVCLGSNRLSIIDLSSAGHMPMASAGGRYWIVYNGEAYNFKQLRDELVARGYSFASSTDSEVVMRAFEHWGEGCLERLVGMFAFAVLDRNTGTLTLARDRFGKKPLYYTHRDGHFFFASEVKALLRVCGGLRPNYQRLIEWSLYRNVDFGQPDTLIENVSSLPPGHLLTVSATSVGTPRAYYSPATQVDAEVYERFSRTSPRTVTGEIESLLQSSVRARLVSDVPVGTLCSGGLDSSLVTALIARDLPDVTAFNVSVEGYEQLDERQYAQKVADSIGIRLLTYPMSAGAFRRNLARAIYHSDFPLTHPNSVAFLLISEFARRHGVIVLLSGEGADELFGGYMQRYRRYRQFLWAQQVFGLLPAKVRKALALAGYASERIPATSFSEYEGLLAHSIGFLDKFARDDLRLRCEDAYRFVRSDGERAALAAMLADITNFLTPLLRRLDRMSMAASVECRTPFLDHHLVRALVNLPLAYRLRGRTDKWMLKEIASTYVPRAVVYRPKVGFPLPVKDYLAPLARKEFFDNGFCLEVLRMHDRGFLEVIDNWQHNVHGFFNLLALEIWGRLFFLHQSVETLTEQLDRTSTASKTEPEAMQAT